MKGNMDYKTDMLMEETQCSPTIRNSMHWEEFFGSSLDLAPALLSIYDSIAANSVVDNQNKTVLDTENEDSLCKVLDTENEDSLCKMASMPSSMEQDRKKRPLSISSMSSSSTSSLSRPTNKRLYLCDQRSSCDSDDKSDSTNNNFGEKLDHLLYIDDDGAANTDEEMAVDINGCSKCSVETIQDDITSQSDLKSSSCSVQPQVPKYISYTHRVVTEIIETERIYINNLQEILEGYLNFIRKSDLNISEESINSLFGNIEDIYDFGRKFLQELETCGDDPVQVAQCFVKNNDGFKIYAEYCTNYPSAVEVLTMIMKDRKLSGVFRHQQGCLNHNLPLGAYLLKPVQRILKYHLLLQNILKNYDKTEAGHEVLIKAFDHMTSMAHHINEMKRKHEHAVRVQEIQSQLEDYDGEDLTRLGELVLEGSFRIYGAKTSRQVFLFEKGVLIGKRKEDGMLSCRVMILCSNLMLVESVPKEPLSFQVIPFDNPRGQHTLQARNLEQKRKWCQEIKRLIIESFKGKIPEKVKGLVMQLGKSQEEDSAKISGLESRKISHHNAPEYLEKRQRMRRKSGTILSDLLKPPRIRRGQRRAESVSPRSSPPSERRVLSQSPSTPNTREFYHGDNSIDITPRTNKIVGRSISFKQAVKRQPLRSVDFGTVDNKENSSEQELTPTTARRNKSFKCATKLNPILSMSCDQLNSCVCSPVPSNQCSVPQISSELSSSNLNGNQLHSNIMQSKSNGVNNSRLLTRFCSMPVLNVMEPSTAYITRNRKCSEETIGQKSKASGQMKVFDTKLYFQRSGNEDLRRGKNSVTAFHDNFLKKSTENLSQKLGPIKLTKPIPFMPSLNATKQPLQKCISIGCKPMNIEDPWERKTNMSMQRHSTRTYSVGDQDIDQMDWLVYANRNSLPVDGFNLGPKLFKYSTSPKSAVETAHAQIKPTDKKGDYPCELSKSDNCLDDLYHTEPNNKDFPNFGALPVVKVNKHSTRLNRSNSTNSQPLSRVDRNLPRHCSTSILETHVVKDHEQIIAEMEDYMKRSESTSTVSSVRFPSEVLSVENKRDSCLSTLSNSSYDSTDTTPSSPPIEYFMGNLKHKINDLKLKLSHRRSGSYDNRDSSDNEVDCDKSKETRSSLLSLLSRKDHTDLQSVLHAGDLGSPSIGQRIAEPDPTYVDVTLSLPRSKTNHLKVNHIEQTKLADGDGTPRLIDNAHLKPSDNLHLQNCDSAFSIQGDITYDNDSPRSQTSHDESRVKRIPSGDSIYERKFSVAFDEGDIFRDSAVYCEMDPQEQILNKGDNAARVPIKSFVKKIEEKSKHIPPPVTRVKQREPGTVIKQRLQSLQTNRSRPSSVERELLFYSRPASLEQEIQFSSQPASQERQARSVSADREMTYSCKSLLRREMSDRPLRSESRYSDEMSTTYSANRLDQLTTDLNNLIVMRGWVKQLIDKFQSKK